tara:strand:+ start:101 stop:319 length:219 start_codon:yes stop_codon:yes gene_type:complete
MRESMKLVLNLSIFLLAFISYSDESYSLTNYQIKRFCTKGKNVSACIKNLQEKKSDLQKGKLIEIPVKPYKR